MPMRSKNRPAGKRTITSAADTHKRPAEQVHLTIRVTEEFRLTLKEEALHRGQTLTEYITEVLLNDLNESR